MNEQEKKITVDIQESTAPMPEAQGDFEHQKAIDKNILTKKKSEELTTFQHQMEYKALLQNVMISLLGPDQNPQAIAALTATGFNLTPEQIKLVQELGEHNKNFLQNANFKLTSEQISQLQQAKANLKQTPIDTMDTPQKQVSNAETLSEPQKIKAVEDILKQLTQTVKANPDGSLMLTQSQLSQIDQLNALLDSQSASSLGTLSNSVSPYTAERALLINDKKARRQAKRELKKQIRAEKRASKDLEKIAKLEGDLANLKNHNNYNLNKTRTLQSLNEALDSGVYINTPIAFMAENPLIVELCKCRRKLRNHPIFTLTQNGKPVEVINTPLIQSKVNSSNEYFQSCGYANVAEKFIHQNTKMSHGQARNMVNTLGTVGLIGAAFFTLRWLFTEDNGQGGRKFGFSRGKLATAIGVPMLANYASQMTTGKSFLQNLETAWRTGKMPWSTDNLDQASPIEKIAYGQNAIQFVLLGVPYSALSQCCSPSTGLITKLDPQKLGSYYQSAIDQAQGDSKTQEHLKTQYEAVKSISNDPKALSLLNAHLAKLNLRAEDLQDKNNADKNLNDLIYQNSENYKKLEEFLTKKSLKINPQKQLEFEKFLYGSEQVLDEDNFLDMQKSGILIANDVIAQTIEQLSISDAKKKELHTAFHTFAKQAKYSGLSLEVINPETIKLHNNGKELLLNVKKNTFDGLKNAAGFPIELNNPEELLQIGLFINHLRSDQGVWSQTPDLTKKGEPNYPFALANTRTSLRSESITFKHHRGDATLISDLIPLVGEMARDFPTIKSEENRQFFINYLNSLWKQDHPE